MHCSVMGQEALEAAISKYRGHEVTPHDNDHAEQEGEIVCKCFGLTEGFLKKVIAANKLHTSEQVTHFTKVWRGVRRLHPADQGADHRSPW